MQPAKVIGSITATVKHSSMQGAKMLLVQPQLVQGQADGDPIIAVDGVGAGMGETVLITSDGRHSRKILQTDATPVRWTIIGIVDE
ncbi:MAG: EutN/CcmL family microcompartment protein [Planctomycetota bacterium]|nr:EutN/CcmL family microcompartment protein [Planctomycetota bacterium]MEC7447651.1 EutN/CcmL family microcompartment protein [Planctomycetota bacterium]MEC7716371.1 EutN/CcmL family microcompartment protein [Planctomycetota bacterium]MEC7978227.1 EutN/CcmL family microcompartment protein [Planctomycetota bacterium]MEC8159823.1 EutN/CcmL family microcompartment protein [Planctomycetota bacterium]